MKLRERLLWTVAIAAVIGTSLWLLLTVTTLAAQVAAAVVALIAGVIAAAVKHGFDLEAQQRQAALLVETQQKHAALLAKQSNYSALLSCIGAFARDPEGAADALSFAHLASWAFGDLAGC